MNATAPPQPAPQAQPVVLRLRGISKRFGDLLANDGIALTLQAGEVLALLGENGAGKSTLMSILFGHYVADAGTIEVFGKLLTPGNTRAALAAGIGMVHQHFTLADNLSVLDNIILGTESLGAWRSARGDARARLLAVARQSGLQVDPDARVASLSVGERQRVEILKALYRGARILVLDEPTAVLTPQESDSLFQTLRHLLADGIAIIFISHKLDEVMAIAHRVVVLRNGRVVAESDTASTDKVELARWMVGQSVTPARHVPAPSTAGRVRLEMRKVSARAGRLHVRPMDLSIAAGEIFGIAGVSGNGQALLAELLSGVVQPQEGSILIDGEPLSRSSTGVVAQGVARVPEDRQSVGVIGDLPIWENLCAEELRAPALSRWGWIRRNAAHAHTQAVLGTFDVRGGNPRRRTRSLSGGNMQKLILGRVLQRMDGKAPCVIVAHQPTWGLDVGAVGFVHGRLRAACEAGAAVLLISDDLDEIELLADRIAVICHGQLSAPRAAADWTREQLGLAMAGTDPPPKANRSGELHRAA